MTNELRQLAEHQLGLLTSAQALYGGMTRSTIRHKLQSGRWQQVLSGVYATFTGELTRMHEVYAAVLYGGPAATITGVAACRFAGMHYVPDDNHVRVLVERDGRRSDHRFVRVITTTRLPDRDLYTPPDAHFPKPVPIAKPYRAAMDAARIVGLDLARSIPRLDNGEPILTDPGAAMLYHHALRTVRALLSEAVGNGYAPLDDMHRELEEGPRHGAALARRAMTDIAAGCRSAPECELRDLISSSDLLPPARFNEPLPGYSRLRPDACWPARRLIVEVDSAEWHRWGDAYERTERRRALLASLGWTVIPVSPQRLRACPAEVLAEIESAYQAATEVA